MLKKSLTSSDKIDFKLFAEADKNLLEIIVVFTALFTLGTTFVYGRVKKFKFDKCLAYIFMAIYIGFLVVVTIIACKKAYWD